VCSLVLSQPPASSHYDSSLTERLRMNIRVISQGAQNDGNDGRFNAGGLRLTRVRGDPLAGEAGGTVLTGTGRQVGALGGCMRDL